MAVQLDTAGTERQPQPRRLGLRGLLGASGFRRLLAVRFSAQLGDGMFQCALAGAVLFNPERQANPMAVAVGFAVLLLPYSIIGPFAGALLDRWDRRRVLWAANLLRALLTVVVAVEVATGVAGAPLSLGALAVAGVTRFVLAGLSAALPHVVDERHLVEANVVAATIGAAVTVLGAVCAIALRAVFGTGNAGSATITAIASLGGLVAALLAIGFRTGSLGPDGRGDTRRALVAVAHGFYDGARATVAVPSVASSFVALACHRLAFGISTLLMLMLFRYTFTRHGVLLSGMGGVGEVLAAGGAGLGGAALVTPWLARRLGRPGAIRVALAVAAVTQLLLATHIEIWVALSGAFMITMAGQVVKLCADSAVQSDVDDAHRGRVFALYDAVSNTAYVVAIVVSALLAPLDGRSPLLLALAAVGYLIGLAAHELVHRRTPHLPRVGALRTSSRGSEHTGRPGAETRDSGC
jgi:MFS family permease